MLINSLVLLNFRNYQNLKIDFHPNINVFHGLNGQGKTNIVEAINYLSTLKSFRNVDDNDLIRFEQDNFQIYGQTIIDKRKKDLKIIFEQQKRKLFINDRQIKKSIDFYGKINTVVFAPNDVTIFIDTKERRRKFLDNEISKLSPSYLYTLNKYKNILKERNQVLKDRIDYDYLHVLTNQLAELADFLISKRIEFIKKLQETSEPIFRQLFNDLDITIDITYQTYLLMPKTSLQHFMENIESDIERQITSSGPHLDDFIVCINQKNIANYGSQGQQRLAILSIKLGLLQLIERINDDNAIVILDDIMSELDSQKRAQILQYLYNKNQVFITTANKEDIEKYHYEINYYNITQGEIK